MKKTFLISCLLVASFPVMAAYTGHVYVDKNKNGVFDKGEKPMSGVKVSDGLNVVETAADGSFTLPGHAGERFIFITTPSGYKTYNRHYHKINTWREDKFERSVANGTETVFVTLRFCVVRKQLKATLKPNAAGVQLPPHYYRNG